MTVTTQNEAAERLYTIFASDVVLEAQVDQVIADIAAAERRATVKRIRAAIEALPQIAQEGDLTAILDEEAAR